ncbi:uncharacterized protein LOC124171333 [Ischnura elegans]|uniref:uncharacterized protein LOC124171333 n=1 Tax=Ischnura elegans TaxID=197161 RepID=UPI001ED86C06|nr:uncharacterized protein LOC124171333 [Ischnura elegans]
MDSFKALLCFMGSSTDGDIPRFDVLTSLPPEMVIKILRMLDPASLLSCALVSKSWLSYVHGDPQLRSRIRQHLRHLRQRRAKPLNIRVRVLREGHEAVPFFASNDRFQMKTIPSKAGASRAEKHAPVIISKGKMPSIAKTLRKARVASHSALIRILGLPIAMQPTHTRPAQEIGLLSGKSAKRSSSKCVKGVRM